MYIDLDYNSVDSEQILGKCTLLDIHVLVNNTVLHLFIDVLANIHALTDEDDLFDVLGEISTLESRYYEIGMGLRLKLKDVRSIEKEDPSRRLSKVIETWLHQQYNVQRHGPPTWQMLVKAVNNPAGGNDNTLARKIASKYPASEYMAFHAWSLYFVHSLT